jgi:CheY-like chemotaxis protein
MATTHPSVIDRLGLAQPLQEASRPSVFIVDDEPMVGEVVSVVLAMEGYNTRLFTSPTDALEAFESAEIKPDLLITDYTMMPLDGAELIARCREISADFRSLLYSGNLTSDEVRKITPTPDAFLSKPFLPKELIQTVKNVLNVRA